MTPEVATLFAVMRARECCLDDMDPRSCQSS